MEKIKTKVFYYKFDISNKEEEKKYLKLKEDLKKKGLKLFDCISLNNYEKKTEFFNKIKELEKRGFIELDLKYLFNNQYNTTEESFNLRVFDWYEEISPNKDIKEGYFLEIPTELKTLKENTFKCGYCGKEYLKKDIKNNFCLSCLGSEYLTEDNLILLRLKSIMDENEFKPLTEEEKRFLMPLYEKEQKENRIKRLKEQKDRFKQKLKEDFLNSKTEYKGFMWLVEKGLSFDNVIFYNHNKTFCFGWRKPLNFEEEQKILKVFRVDKFPFQYEIKTQ